MIDYEVWQLDLRADKIYMAELNDRLLHKNFPAQKKKFFRGLKISEYIFSKEIIEYARQYNDKNVTFILPAALIDPFKYTFLKSIDKTIIIYRNFISTSLLLPTLEASRNPLKLLHRYLLSKKKLHNLKIMKHLLALNDNPNAMKYLITINKNINVYLFAIGMDYDYWQQDKSIQEARQYLNISLNKFVIFLSQRLTHGYQIDKFIKAISSVNSRREFVCYISGHGKREYESYLRDIVKQYRLEDRINFVGYVSDEELKNYFIACDVFVTVPKITAGSNGAKKAMAINKPIVHITQGDTYEYLKDNHAGLFLSPTDYDQWTKIFEEVIDGKIIKTVPREKVVDYFSWKTTAKEILHAIINARKS
jgi:glycosyltransferase involved in cell wall biosynthesis